MSELKRTQIWNCGGGTQSAAIAALIVSGRLPVPDLAVIVDTEREKSTTWKYADSILIPQLASVGVTLHRVPKSKYATVDLWGGADGNSLLIPAYTTKGDEVGKLPNFCSHEWKTRVVQRWATIEHAVTAATNWIGFSTDEHQRAKSSGSGKWLRRFPLIELGISRNECRSIIRRMGWPQAPRSACWLCPNQGEHEWRDTRENAPTDFTKAAALQAEIQKRDPHAWLHHECKPLDQIDFSEKNEVLFRDCDSGMCFI